MSLNNAFTQNRPRSIYQYSSMAPRLSGQNCKFFKFLLSLNSHRRLGYKENNTKYRRYTRKPRAHVRILIYRTWPITVVSNSTKRHADHIHNQCRSRVKIIGGAHHERQSHEVLGSPGECSSGKFLYRGSLK